MTGVIFIVAVALLGLAMLLSGVWLLPKGLTTLGSSAIKKGVAHFTSTPLTSTVTGTVVTVLVQSSSAVTVISMSLINSGIMSFTQGLGIILGTNVGTTMTVQLMAFNLTNLSPWLLIIGVLLLAFPNPKVRAMAQSILGLGGIFFGLLLLENAFRPWSSSYFLFSWLQTLDNNHFLSLITGIIITALLQSSSAVLGLTLALATQDMVSLPGAVAIMLGSNLGTCITALLVSTSSNLEARRLALSHVLLNALGAMVFFPFIESFARLLTMITPELTRQIAHGHTIYNIICSLLVLPFINQFAGLVQWLLPGQPGNY